jgi:thymidylate kinase
MLTVIEGPDCGGKSTWARWLQAHAPGTSIHAHGPYSGEARTVHHYWATVLASMQPGAHVVADRAWPSEPVYGEAYRGGSDRVGVQRRLLERAAFSAEGVVAYFLPPYPKVVQAWTARKGDEYLDEERQLRRVYELFLEQFMNASGLPSVLVDWTVSTPREIRELIDAGRAARDLGPGLGHWNPGRSVLIVLGDGDDARASERGQAPPRQLPGCDFRASESSLLDALEAEGVHESALYWACATPDLSPHFIDDLQPAGVVAVGRKAERWCNAHAVPNDAVPHPAWWTRNRRGERHPVAAAAAQFVRPEEEVKS